MVGSAGQYFKRRNIGQSALIQGGAGGVGSFAIQFAKHLGASVIMTTSAPNVDSMCELGADEVIDYTKQGVRPGSGRPLPGFDEIALHDFADLVGMRIYCMRRAMKTPTPELSSVIRSVQGSNYNRRP